MNPIRFETVKNSDSMFRLFNFPSLLHQVQEVGKTKLKHGNSRFSSSGLTPWNIVFFRMLKFEQLRKHFLRKEQLNLFYRLLLSQFTFRKDPNVEIRFDKILLHKFGNFGVSSYWDSSAWRSKHPRTPRKRFFRIGLVFLIDIQNYALNL